MEKKLNRSPVAGLLLLALLWAAACTMTAGALTGRQYDLRAGDKAPETIYATRDVADSVATNALREAARENVKTIYRIDEARVEELNKTAKAFFVSIGSLRSYAVTGSERRTAGEWAEALSDAQKATYMAMTTPSLSEAQLCAVLAARDTDLELLENIVLPKLSTALGAGLGEESRQSVLDACVRELQATTGLSEALKSVGESVLKTCMQTTFIEDSAATELARSEAAASVETVQIRKGESIVMAGSAVSEAQFAMLTELGLVHAEGTGVALPLGAAVCLFLGFGAFTVYLAQQARETLLEGRRMLLLAIPLLLCMAAYMLSGRLSACFTCAMFAILLSAALLSTGLGLAVSFLMAYVTGLMAGGAGALLSYESFSTGAAVALSGVVAVYSLRGAQSRGAYIGAGAAGGFAGTLALLGMDLMRGASVGTILSDAAFFMGGCVLSALLMVGSLSIWEKLFDAATPARLHELLSTANPLLRQLMAEAPGTYQHSMNVASLAEAAAQRVGADPLLSRVGAIYHDVGKLRRPLYFAENQKKGENIHDTLPPLESAAAIIAHQKDGASRLSKAKFPSAVVRIVGEHHGNSLVAYFYYKAQKDDPTVQQKDFRYTGSKPSCKESAIVMLADSCEAAVRSLGECTEQAREEMVHKVIWGKMDDAKNNLLSDVPLTLKQISDVEHSFLRTFNGIMHDRIEYPQEDKA